MVLCLCNMVCPMQYGVVAPPMLNNLPAPQQLQHQTYSGNTSQAPMIANYASSLPQPAPTSSTPQAMLAGTSTSPSSNWYPDSGASHHVTSNVQNIQQCAPFEGSDQVIIGHG